MNPRPCLSPFTHEALARETREHAGRPADALRCYETLAALWVRCCDTGLPGAASLQDATERAADLLTGGAAQAAWPAHGTVPDALLDDDSVVRIPSALAVQGVEWPDLTALAQRWLDTRATGEPLHVVGVRTGGAYLAPLVAGHLARAGLDVQLSALRHGEPLRSSGRRIVLVDGPPLTCRTLLALAADLDGPNGLEVLLPCFHEDDAQPLRDAGYPVTVLAREQWQSTLRLAPQALAAYLEEQALWLTGKPADLDGFQPDRENSALLPWPGGRGRSPARAAVRLRSTTGVVTAVASWIPPGLFGDAARYAATSLSTPATPATLALAPAMALTESVAVASRLGRDASRWSDEALDYVLARAEQLPISRSPAAAAPFAVRHVVQAVTSTASPQIAAYLYGCLVRALPAALPDNRLETEKWLIDAEGRLRKGGHLMHAYRRANELLTPGIDLAALGVTFDLGLEELARRLERRGVAQQPLRPALALALLCHAAARGEQIARTYTPERAVEIALEAHRLQRGMAEAAALVQSLIRPGGDCKPPLVVRRWAQPPAELMQVRLPFGGEPAEPVPTVSLAPEEIEASVMAWVGERFRCVRADRKLLLAPLDAPARWPQAAAELPQLAALLPDPQLLAWCGVPVVALETEH
ncbi:hypothetical protein [Streptomyces lydicus]|uniref:hypothetical protein n=1 Tax=Streptomyces lydicus TaxID=47763 RepID=UPI0037BC05BA